MSHLTDDARAPYRGETANVPAPDSLEAIVAANPTRRSLLKNGLLGLSVLPTMALAACGDTSGDPHGHAAPDRWAEPDADPDPAADQLCRDLCRGRREPE